MNTSLSDHAIKRGKQRLKLRGKALSKRVQDAWDKGATVNDLDKETGHWLLRKLQTNPQKNAVGRILGADAFLFGPNGICITILKVPPPSRIHL